MFTWKRADLGAKLILIAAVVCLGALNPGPAMAGGLIAYEFGTADVGLASAGYGARAQDASTVFTNPAGMTRLAGTQFLAAGQVLWGNTNSRSTPALRRDSAARTAAMRSGQTGGSSAAAGFSATACRPISSSGLPSPATSGPP